MSHFPRVFGWKQWNFYSFRHQPCMSNSYFYVASFLVIWNPEWSHCVSQYAIHSDRVELISKEQSFWIWIKSLPFLLLWRMHFRVQRGHNRCYITWDLTSFTVVPIRLKPSVDLMAQLTGRCLFFWSLLHQGYFSCCYIFLKCILLCSDY